MKLANDIMSFLTKVSVPSLVDIVLLSIKKFYENSEQQNFVLNKSVSSFNCGYCFVLIKKFYENSERQNVVLN